jgi:glutathione S-transferase
MTTTIAPEDVKLRYASLAEARTLPRLRLILGARAIPGPWREACKAIFHVKKIPYVPVASRGADGSDRELYEWTAQRSAPVAIWDDERPRSTWVEQLYLAERLEPEPALIPAAIDDRVAMFGHANELCGETGFGWSKRLTMIHKGVTAGDDAARAGWRQFGGKYGYSEAAAAAAPARMVAILRCLGALLQRQRDRGNRFLIGDRLSALDIYWATFAALIEPLPPELCPMGTAFREHYTERDPAVVAAASPSLMQHRDFIYREYLELPIVF